MTVLGPKDALIVRLSKDGTYGQVWFRRFPEGTECVAPVVKESCGWRIQAAAGEESFFGRDWVELLTTFAREICAVGAVKVIQPSEWPSTITEFMV